MSISEAGVEGSYHEFIFENFDDFLVGFVVVGEDFLMGLFGCKRRLRIESSSWFRKFEMIVWILRSSLRKESMEHFMELKSVIFF